MQPAFLVTAHAGLACHLPGRIPTKETIEESLALGATVIELDIPVTKDDVLLVTHEHLTPSGRRVRDTTFAQFVGERSAAATLDQVVEWIGGRAALLLDLKIEYGDNAAVSVVTDWLNAHTDLNVAVCEKNAAALQQIRDAAPHVPLWRTLPEVDSRLGRISWQVVLELRKQRKRNGWRAFGKAVALAIRDVPSSRLDKFRLLPWLGLESEVQRLTSDVGATGLTVERFLATRELCLVAEQLGIRVIAWVVNENRDAQRLIKAGVSGLTTDNPASISVATAAKLQRIGNPGLAA